MAKKKAFRNKKLHNNVTKVESKKITISKRLSDFFEIPKEITLNVPLITITGNSEMTIENYKGVIEYTEEKIRINTSCGIMRIEGKNLFLKQITAEHILVTGLISHFDYLM